MKAPSLPGFGLVDHPGARALVREEAIPWVRYVLEGGGTLYATAARDRHRIQLPGRSPVYAIPAKGHRSTTLERADELGGSTAPADRWVVRHYARGGRALPTLLGDRYLNLGTPRPLHEARISQGAISRGITTPKILAAVVYPGLLSYRADLVTEYVPSSTDLIGSLFDTGRKGAGGASERLEGMRAAGALVRTLSQGGLLHGDLNGGNILLQWEGTLPRAWVLDLDRARLFPPGSAAPTDPMLRRLKRSLRKWGRVTGLTLTEREWGALDEAVGA
jgi:hypothetical protein